MFLPSCGTIEELWFVILSEKLMHGRSAFVQWAALQLRIIYISLEFWKTETIETIVVHFHR